MVCKALVYLDIVLPLLLGTETIAAKNLRAYPLIQQIAANTTTTAADLRAKHQYCTLSNTQ